MPTFIRGLLLGLAALDLDSNCIEGFMSVRHNEVERWEVCICKCISGIYCSPDCTGL